MHAGLACLPKQALQAVQLKLTYLPNSDAALRNVDAPEALGALQHTRHLLALPLHLQQAQSQKRMSCLNACAHKGALEQLPYLLLQHGRIGSPQMLHGVIYRTGKEPRSRTLSLLPYMLLQHSCAGSVQALRGVHNLCRCGNLNPIRKPTCSCSTAAPAARMLCAASNSLRRLGA